MEKILIEALGYIGSLLVVISMLMTSVMKLRIINTVGSVIFAIYAIIIKSYPTAAMNFALVIINLLNMKKLSTETKVFNLVETERNDKSLEYVLNRYNTDIKQYFPKFDKEQAFNKSYLIYCEDNLAGCLLGNLEDGNIDILLDYSTPVYRDWAVGNFLFPTLKKQGIKSLTLTQETYNHDKYLGQMGFVKVGNSYRKDL